MQLTIQVFGLVSSYTFVSILISDFTIDLVWSILGKWTNMILNWIIIIIVIYQLEMFASLSCFLCRRYAPRVITEPSVNTRTTGEKAPSRLQSTVLKPTDIQSLSNY